MTARIEKTATLKSPVGKVWDAITDHKKFGEWFRVDLENPFRVGEMTRGVTTYPGYEGFKWQARTVALDPKTYFAFRWPPNAVDESRDYSDEDWTLVEFRLEPAGTGTKLTIIESGFENIPADRRDEAYRSNTEGWDIQIRNVEAFVDG